MKNITDQDFEKEIKEANLVLVDFFADWCGPCKMLSPKLEELAEELKDKVTIVKMNVDDHPLTAQKLQIRGIPFLALYKNGQLVDKLVGNQAKEIIKDTILKRV